MSEPYDVAALILEEHGGLLPRVAQLGTLAAESSTLSDRAFRQRLAAALDFLHDDLLPHAAEEERSVYPAVEKVVGGAGEATRTMSIDHRFIGEMVAALAAVKAGPLKGPGRERARRLLYGLEALLEVHLAKENEAYVPLLASLPEADRRALYTHLTGHPSEG